MVALMRSRSLLPVLWLASSLPSSLRTILTLASAALTLIAAIQASLVLVALGLPLGTLLTASAAFTWIESWRPGTIRTMRRRIRHAH
jgi:hypothetical protein